MRIKVVAALDENDLIGVNVNGEGGALPWRLPQEMAHFKAETAGRPVIMGRRTAQSLGSPLVGRSNIVLSHLRAWDGFTVVGTMKEAYAAAALTGAEECVVIGGASVFSQALMDAHQLVLTRVHHQFAPGGSPTYFPRSNILETRAREARALHHPVGPGNPWAWTATWYELRR